jgi:hypothetical protein
MFGGNQAMEAHGLLLVLALCDAHYSSHMSKPNFVPTLSYSQELSVFWNPSCPPFGTQHLRLSL